MEMSTLWFIVLVSLLYQMERLERLLLGPIKCSGRFGWQEYINHSSMHLYNQQFDEVESPSEFITVLLLLFNLPKFLH